MSRFLGIDLGTQSLKAIVYDSENREIAAAGSSDLQLISRADGTREQLAEWWIEALHQALRQIPPPCLSSVKAIAVSGQQHGFVPLAAEVDEHIEFDEQYGAVPDPATQAIYDQQFEIYNSYLD